MNLPKSASRIVANKKKRVFVIKTVIYILMFTAYKLIGSVTLFLTTHPEIHSIYRAALFLLGSNILVSLGSIITVRIYLRKSRDERMDGNFILGINWISNIVNAFLLIIALMLAFDVQPLEFLTSLTIVAAAIAILTKEYVTNMINGLIIMFTDQFGLGDLIKVGEHKGTIEDINLINVVIKKSDGHSIFIPNNLMLNSQVINHSRDYLRQIEIQVELPSNFIEDLEEVRNKLSLLVFDKEVSSTSSKLQVELVSILKDAVVLRVLVQTPYEQEKVTELHLQNAVLKFIHENKKRELL
jgi:small-conductance mechanosensitive channel